MRTMIRRGSRPAATAVLALLLAACTDSGTTTVASGGDAASDATASDAAASDTAASDADGTGGVINVTSATFDCLKDWQQVRRFRIKRLVGDVADSLAVANSADGGTYPAGTVIQLIPTEAMVKREAGFSPATKDWEFFFLKVSKDGTEIAGRGTTEVKNGFGGNCFGCHNAADPKWDLVCEQDHGCAKLPFSSDIIQSFQDSDPRCPSGG